jgi:murein endopeptidase
MSRRTRTGAVALAAACTLALPGCGLRELEAQLTQPVPQVVPEPEIVWKRSMAVGTPSAGRLVRGVRLPAEGEHFFTWDPVKRRSPNRAWRRWGTDRMVRLVLRIAREFGEAHPYAPRMSVGDLSRPRGGDFGPQFGYLGHASHQNGLDVDIYYPRADRLERAPRDASQIDRRLSQELVDRFVEAGAVKVFVGPNTGLTGPPEVVAPLINHDNHIHVRIGRRR